MRKKINYRLKFHTFTNMLSCTLVLLLMGVTILRVLATQNLKKSLMEDSLVVTLTLGGSNEMQLGEEENLTSRINEMQHALKAENYVDSVRYINAHEVLLEQMEVMGSNPEEFLGFNPFYNEMEVSINARYANNDSLKALTERIQTKYPLVSEVQYDADFVENTASTIRHIEKITMVLIWLALLLLVVLLTLTYNIVHLTIYARRFQINTMKLVGASPWFIHRSFLLRSLLSGILSGIFACLLLTGITTWMENYDKTLCQYATTQDLLYTLLLVFVLGLVLLMACTFVSVNRFIGMSEQKMYR